MDQYMKRPRWFRRPLLVVHVTAGVSLIGTTLVLLALGISGLRGADPWTVYPAASLVKPWLVAPLAVIALTSGLVQTVTSEWGLVSYWWVVIKFTVMAVLTVVVLLVPAPGLATIAHTAAGQITDQQRLRVALFPAAALTLLILNVVLGIYKPRWRLRPALAPLAKRCHA
jgi:hypothetical protein